MPATIDPTFDVQDAVLTKIRAAFLATTNPATGSAYSSVSDRVVHNIAGDNVPTPYAILTESAGGGFSFPTSTLETDPRRVVSQVTVWGYVPERLAALRDEIENQLVGSYLSVTGWLLTFSRTLSYFTNTDPLPDQVPLIGYGLEVEWHLRPNP